MLRMKSIPVIGLPNEYEDFIPDPVDMSFRLTDDSFFVPNKEANKILARQAAGQILDNMLYDDEADIKSGAINVYARQKGRDIAEITQQNIALVKESNKVLEKAKATVMKQIEAQVQSQAQSQSSSTGE